MFGEKTNDTLVTSIVGVLGLGIIYLVTTSYQMNIDMKNLQDTQEKMTKKVNILIAYIQTDKNPSKQKLKKEDLLIFLSNHGVQAPIKQNITLDKNATRTIIKNSDVVLTQERRENSKKPPIKYEKKKIAIEEIKGEDNDTGTIIKNTDAILAQEELTEIITIKDLKMFSSLSLYNNIVIGNVRNQIDLENDSRNVKTIEIIAATTNKLKNNLILTDVNPSDEDFNLTILLEYIRESETKRITQKYEIMK